MSKLAFSLLDPTVIWNGATASQVIAESMEIAMLAEQLGYKRYWFSENHNTANHASSTPELLVAKLAAFTNRIKLGTSNLMLPHQSALKVVENFRTMLGIYPGRIDLGIDLTIGEDLMVAQALHRTHEVIGKEEYPEQLQDLLMYLTDSYSTSRGKIMASPQVTTVPDIWIHGSNHLGARYASEYGLGIVFEHQSSPYASIEVLRAYRKYFKPSVFRTVPHSILIVSTLGVNRDESSRVGLELRQLAEESGVDEVMIVTHHPDVQIRKRSIELLASEFQLTNQPHLPSEGVNSNVHS